MKRTLGAALLSLTLLSACSGSGDTTISGGGLASTGPSTAAVDAFLGAGLLAFPDEASRWVETHADDPRADAIDAAIAGRPTALWLTGDESFGNLDEAVAMAREQDRAMVLTLYNVPLRWDGLSDPSPVTLEEYEAWIDRVVAAIGDTRAVIVLEPDALWFYDRMPTDAQRTERQEALTYAVERFGQDAPRTRLYLEAGTSSGSVTPERMAELLIGAGIEDAAGFAVNVSSYSPADDIYDYAQGIRSALMDRGVADPRYVTDTGRNGASTWDNTWCNDPDQQLGTPPGPVGTDDGRDLDLWVKAPGTSDGDCGPVDGGSGTYGGEFIPELAYRMVGGSADS